MTIVGMFSKCGQCGREVFDDSEDFGENTFALWPDGQMGAHEFVCLDNGSALLAKAYGATLMDVWGNVDGDDWPMWMVGIRSDANA